MLLSATPMFNDYKEIKFILNTLLINNKDKQIDNKLSIFNNNNELTEEFKKILIKSSNKFISYMRGENPYTFPIRLYPSINKDKNLLETTDYPTKDINNNNIQNNEQIKYLELIHTKMSSLQNDIYNTIKVDEDEESDKVDLQQRVQVSNIIFPNKNILDNDNELKDGFDIKNSYGKIGFDKVFNKKDDKRQKVE